MWGKANENAINFEWPTQKMLDGMPSETKLESITFKETAHGRAFVSSVQCHLTSGEASPEMKTTGKLREEKTIHFDRNRPVKFVRASVHATEAAFNF